MKEEYKDIIGKSFIGFKFPSERQLGYQGEHTLCEGCEGEVISLHSQFPKFAFTKIRDNQGRLRNLHYPSALLKAQIQDREDYERMNTMSVEDLISEMKQLTSKI
jgi:hypothetical protein